MNNQFATIIRAILEGPVFHFPETDTFVCVRMESTAISVKTI